VKPVEIFHVGPQESGTRWIYRCLAEHPEVACPPADSIHYFDMHFARGREWYTSHFLEAREGQKLFDPTPSYLRSPWAPRRIAQENPRARIALCLRNPIDRAFSHYRRGEAKRRFDDVLSVYDCYANWLEPGMYAEHVERLLEHFPPEQLLCQTYDRLERDPRGFLDELFCFLSIDASFTPPVLNRRADGIMPRSRSAFGWLKSAAGIGDGISSELRDRLEEICEPEIARLERLLEIDLDEWRRPLSLP